MCVLPIKSSSNTFLCVITPQIMGPVCKSTNHIISQILHQTCQGLWMVEAELRLEATVEEATEGQVGQLTFGRFSCEKLISALSYPDHCMPRCLLACFFFTFSRFSYLKGLHNSTQNLTQDHLRWRHHRKLSPLTDKIR